jgi:Tfp pilus assembly protein PilN
MTTMTQTHLAAMPRVNLLPPEIAAAARLKRLRAMLGLAVAGIAVVVVLLFVLVSGEVGAAQSDLDAAQAVGAQRTAEKANYAEVPLVYASVETAQQNLATAMTPEIRWSFYLNDLSLTIPRTTRLSSMTAVNDAAAAQLAGGATLPAAPTTTTTTDGTTTTPAPTTAPVVASMGSISFTGKSTDFDAVAAWLQSLSRVDGYSDPFVQNVAQADSTNTVGDWFDVESSTKLDIAALSNRYLQIGTGE